MFHEIHLHSAMPTGSVFPNLRKKGGLPHWSSKCIVQNRKISHTGLQLCNNGWDYVRSLKTPALGLCSIETLLSAAFLFWCFI